MFVALLFNNNPECETEQTIVTTTTHIHAHGAIWWWVKQRNGRCEEFWEWSVSAEGKTQTATVSATVSVTGTRSGGKWRGVTVHEEQMSQSKERKKKTTYRIQMGEEIRRITHLCWGWQEDKVKPIKQTHVVIYNQLEDKYELNIQRQHVHITHLCSYSGSRQLRLQMTDNRWMNHSVKWMDVCQRFKQVMTDR